MAWLIAEDEALKNRLSGIVVTRSNNTSYQVPVYFRLPEQERIEVTYPFISIDQLSIRRDPEREHRGRYIPTYIVDEDDSVTFATGQTKVTELPIPVKIYYQITTYALNFKHDRALVSALHATARIPLRFGQLYIPEDGTYRRMDRVGEMRPADIQAGKDRIFRKVFTVSVTSELNPAEFFDRYLVDTQPDINIEFFWPEELVIPTDD